MNLGTIQMKVTKCDFNIKFMFFRFFIEILFRCNGNRIEHLNGSFQLVVYKVIEGLNLVSHQSFQMIALKIGANNFPRCFFIFNIIVVVIIAFYNASRFVFRC